MVLQEDVMARKIEHCYQFCKSEQGLSLVIITKIFFTRKKELNEKKQKYKPISQLLMGLFSSVKNATTKFFLLTAAAGFLLYVIKSFYRYH